MVQRLYGSSVYLYIATLVIIYVACVTMCIGNDLFIDMAFRSTCRPKFEFIRSFALIENAKTH